MPVKVARLHAFGPSAERAEVYNGVWRRLAHDLAWRCACLMALPEPLTAAQLHEAKRCARRSMRAFDRFLHAAHVADALRKAMHERAGE